MRIKPMSLVRVTLGKFAGSVLTSKSSDTRKTGKKIAINQPNRRAFGPIQRTYAAQSQHPQNAQSANQNAKQIHVAGAKRGKMRAGKARLVFICFSSVKKVARVFLTNHRA